MGSLSTAPPKSSLLESLNKNGFVVVPSVLNPSQLTQLREATQATAAYARAGKWPHVRTLPKQFPPWPVTGPNPAEQGIWGVQLLMHPNLPEHEIFIKTYFSQALIEPTKELLDCEDDELVMELFNLLIRPDRDFELRWHRDDIPPTATAEEELERLKEPAWHAQWNLALYDDASLIVVPESHTRARTKYERDMDPYEQNVPNQLIVKLNAGDIVFYNNNILHRGAYDSSVERMTLHGSVGHVQGGSLRARNVLQHGVKDWVEECDLDVLEGNGKARALRMRENLVKLGGEHGALEEGEGRRYKGVVLTSLDSIVILLHLRLPSHNLDNSSINLSGRTSLDNVIFFRIPVVPPTTRPCPTTGLPAESAPYFYLKTNTLFNPSSPKNNLYLSDFQIFTFTSIAVLVPLEEIPWYQARDLAFLNNTYLQFATGPETATNADYGIYRSMLFGDANQYIAPQMISYVFGGTNDTGDGREAGYHFNDTDGSGRKGLKAPSEMYPASWIGWMACDWFGTEGKVQLIPQYSSYWDGIPALGPDGVLPGNCEAVELLPEYPSC